MTQKKFNFILGSASPRRRELLGYTFCPFSILTSEFAEESNKEDVSEWVMDIASQKARDIYDQAIKKFENPLILSADTIVVKDGVRLGKPSDRADARKTLKLLSGSDHQVLTGVCLKSSKNEESFFSQTTVSFEEINDELLELYLNTGEPFDKAGSYGIQAYGLAFVKSVSGSYSNVVGLPVNQVLIKLESYVKSAYPDANWRDAFEK